MRSWIVWAYVVVPALVLSVVSVLWTPWLIMGATIGVLWASYLSPIVRYSLSLQKDE
jgi:hypothetical protein